MAARDVGSLEQLVRRDRHRAYHQFLLARQVARARAPKQRTAQVTLKILVEFYCHSRGSRARWR